jgi:hypothetical protein
MLRHERITRIHCAPKRAPCPTCGRRGRRGTNRLYLARGRQASGELLTNCTSLTLQARNQICRNSLGITNKTPHLKTHDLHPLVDPLSTIEEQSKRGIDK